MFDQPVIKCITMVLLATSLIRKPVVSAYRMFFVSTCFVLVFHKSESISNRKPTYNYSDIIYRYNGSNISYNSNIRYSSNFSYNSNNSSSNRNRFSNSNNRSDINKNSSCKVLSISSVVRLLTARKHLPTFDNLSSTVQEFSLGNWAPMMNRHKLSGKTTPTTNTIILCRRSHDNAEDRCG